ncbi:helix-turn-helix transcriptional regulator [Micromonospora sp. WMMD998]|uniref:helix-turn-helix domain-containing protein n=1 Tax=Micromonospora sp. WMMD998 TaxID=3016092 RepID=UPI00249CA2C7|nr:helix-turn-helix transcriptional regulator [Micromonospora sp. WMMD998]WFE37077.1 helix-turn-helix transcriptional regulator [Micromonospora sp. WMMD998]
MSGVPSPLADFIVSEIRRARGMSGMTQETFGRSAGFSASHVSAVESGSRALTMDFVKGTDRALRNGGFFERLVAKLGAPSWFLPWLDAERGARQLRLFEPLLIPGLLQTENYARVVMRLNDLMSTEEVDQRVSGRMSRHRILTSETPPQVVVVLDESALHRAGEEFSVVIAEQVAHLIVVAELPHVHIHVIPATAGLHIGLSGPFALARGEDGRWVGHLENQLGGIVVDGQDELHILEARWENVRTEALPRRQSLDLLKEVQNHHGSQ